MNTAPIVSRVWSFCTTLRDDGVSYGDYLEQLDDGETIARRRCQNYDLLPLRCQPSQVITQRFEYVEVRKFPALMSAMAMAVASRKARRRASCLASRPLNEPVPSRRTSPAFWYRPETTSRSTSGA